MLQAIFLKLVSKVSSKVVSLRLKKSILLFNSNLHAINMRSLTESKYYTELRRKVKPRFRSWLILSSNYFLSKIHTQIPLKFCQHNNHKYLHHISDSIKLDWHNNCVIPIYTTKMGFFSMIIIIMLYGDGESLNLHHFSLGLPEMFYLQTVQSILCECFHENRYLRGSLNLTCLKDFFLESYKYDKINVRIIVINYSLSYSDGTSDLLSGFKLSNKWKH